MSKLLNIKRLLLGNDLRRLFPIVVHINYGIVLSCCLISSCNLVAVEQERQLLVRSNRPHFSAFLG